MKNTRKKFNSIVTQSLKNCLDNHSVDNSLILLFQLTDKFPEIDNISQKSTGLDLSSSLFNQYKIDQTDFLCVLEHKGSSSYLNSSTIRKIISLIKKSNKKNPPDAIGLIVDVRYLRVSDTRDIFQKGQLIRTWIDVIRDATSQNIPITLIIRNAEDLDGFSDWTNSIPETRLNEAFGFALPDEEIEAQSFISAAIREINNNLLSFEIQDNDSDAPGKRLTKSLISLKQNISSLANGILQTQPDLTPPKFIGVYFMGMVNSSVPQIDETALDLVADEEMEKLPDSGVTFQQPVFVKDVCTEIFPKATTYTQPYEPESKYGIFSKIISACMLLTLIVFAVLLFTSYISHLNTLQNTHQSISMLQKNIATPLDAVPYFHSLKNNILDLESTVTEWWLPWLGFSDDIEVINQLKHKYVITFRKYLLKPLIDEYLVEVRKHMGQRSAIKEDNNDFHKKSAKYMGTLVFYVDHINKFLSSPENDYLNSQSNWFKNGKEIFIKPLSNERYTLFLACYDQALIWAKHKKKFRKDLHLLQTSIQEMVVVMPSLIEWTIPFVNDQVMGIQLANLWKKEFHINLPDSEIQGAFTIPGYNFIGEFFNIIRKAHSQPASFDERLNDFKRDYQEKYIQKWEKESKEFLAISEHLDGRSDWADVMTHLSDEKQNPFFKMIKLLVEHTKHLKGSRKNWPKWLSFSHQLYENTSIGISSESKHLTKTSIDNINVQKVKNNNEVAISFQEYVGALKRMSDFPDSPERSYKLIKNFFTNYGEFCPGDGPDTIACLSIFQLQSMWAKRNKENAAFWDLYEGPLNFIQRFSIQEAACQIQQHWEDKVLSADTQAAPNELVKTQKAETKKFINTICQPFLEKITQTRYAPKRISNMTLPFNDSLFKYVAFNPGTQKLKNRYPVIIKALPSRTNSTSEFQPQLTLIKMKCQSNQQILIIGHQPTQETFFWSESCGPVHIIFHLNDMKLTRTYPNPMAFPKFIRDVRYGSKRFHSKDFALHNSKLKSMGIEYIELQLKLFGYEPLTKAQNRGFMPAPTKITYCWESKKSKFSEKQAKSDTPPKKEKSIEQVEHSDKKQSENLEKQTQVKEKTDADLDKDFYLTIIASFRNEKNAGKKARYLTKKGLPCSLYWLKDNNDKRWYIVVSGLYTEYSKAMEQVEIIKDKYQINPFLKKMNKKTINSRKVKINF